LSNAFENIPYDEERRGPARVFGATTARADVVVAVAAAIAVATAAAIVAEGGAASEPAALTAVLVANIATLAVAGLLWRSSRPSSRIGTLLLLEGLLVAVSSLAASSDPAAHRVGVLAAWAAAIGAIWLVLAFPRMRPRGRGASAVLALALAAFAVDQLPLLPAQAQVNVESVLQALTAAGLVAYMVIHFMQASRPHRRTLTLLYAAMIPFALAGGVTALLSGLAGVQVGDVGQAMLVATRIVAPLGFVGGLLYARAYVAEALAYMSTRLVGEPSLASVEHLVRTVLDDPLAKLAFWLPRSGKFVDRHGKQITEQPSEDVSWWSLPHDGNPILAIVHDSVLDEDPELLEAVGMATTLALENRRLHHDLVDTVHALHASQKRLVSAASEERRRLERDLHDGAQQKLVALRIRVDLARSRELGAESRSELGEFGSDLDDALHDLRSLAHGIFPPLLAEEGLDAALREAARRSAVAVEVGIEDPGRLSPECETAVYYCCLEALQNVAKHAGDDVVATLRLWPDQRAVRFSVADDGSGFVTDNGGGDFGLTNMSDRIGAVGGSLTVRSSPGAGTKVEGQVPRR
jgi:signal transduction histidine kinase